MLKLFLPLLLLSCSRYHLAHQCNLNTCETHKKEVQKAKTKTELRPRYKCQVDKKDGRCLWVQI